VCPGALPKPECIVLLGAKKVQFTSSENWINLVTDGLTALCLATDPIDPDVMKRHPRPRSERITNRSFLRTMFLTGILTAGVAFAVYFHVLRTETTETSRASAFAELLRAFGARSETKPVWRISLFTNRNLVIAVAISFGIQMWSQHNATLGRFLKTSYMPFADWFLLVALGSIPLLVLELAKVVRHTRQQRKIESNEYAKPA
jgi:P-type Ca2+ transporter type 2C